MIIVLFHVLYFFSKFVYQNYGNKKQKTINDDTINTDIQFKISERDYKMIDPSAPQDFEEKSIKFFPPAYLQRYIAVADVIDKYHGKLRKIVDFGCAELDFLVYLKNRAGIEEILCVDVDRSLLEASKSKAAPLVSEYLHTRTTPLVVEICEGSVIHNDKKLENTDAVICIELIEHLHSDILLDVPYNIFGYIKPKLAVITTPNADFNVLFPNFSGFRHPDHKFEWTREQFQNWADNIVLRYPDYSVTFDGICKGPEGSEHLGCCTQMAVFHRISEKEFCNIGIENLFKTIVKYEYPFRIDNRSDEEKILDEAAYYIRYLSYQNEDMEEEVPLNVLINMLKSFHISTNTLQTILEDGGWTIENHESGPVVLVPPISTFSDDSAVLSEIAQFNDHSDLYSDEDWPREAGPPINCNRFLRQESSDIWTNENWNEESIVIPQNNSIPNNNTYLFDEENVLLNNESETTRNTEIFERENEISDEENLINAISNIDNFNNSFYNANRLRLNESTELPNSLASSLTKFEDVKEDSFFYIVSDAQNDPTSSTAQKLNRTLDIPVYMSVSRASTSPEPYLLHAIKMDLKNDSMYNQSMSNHWMLNNSFEQVLNMSIDAQDTNNTKHNKSLEYNCDDHLHNKYLNTSYKGNEDSDIEYNIDNTNTSTNYFNQSEVQNDRHNSKISKSNSKLEDESNNVVVTSNALIENRPQFTSSPKIEIKMNNMKKKQRSLDYDEQKNDSSSNITQKSQLTNDSSNNLSENNKILSQSNKNINIFTMSDSYSNAIKENYNKDTSLMHQVDEKIKNKNQLTNNSNQNIFIDSDALTIASTLNNDIQITEELLETNFMSSNNSKKRITSSLNSIFDQNKWPDFSITENIVKEQKEFPILNTNNIQSINCDTKFSLKNQLMIKSESQIDIYNNDGRTELHNDHNLKNIKNVNNTEVSSNHAKDITSLENIPLVSTLHIEDKRSIQFISVLKSEERSECNIKNLESKYKNINIVEVIENIELKSSSPEIVETPPKSWSPEIIDSGYPNSASAQDMTPEYDLPSIAQDHISESESASIAEAPEVGMLEVIEVENGDLANNNRDDEGNNMIAAELNDLEDLQPLIEVLENDIENENDIYAVENDFPIWLLRILNMANPIDVEIHMRDHRELRFANRVADDDARYINIERDEGFDSTSEENSDLENNEMRDNINENALNIENDNENASNSDSGSEQWITGDT